MQTFIWDGVTYAFDADTCRSGLSLIRLPDGTILRPQGWVESNPPKPTNLIVISPTQAMRATPAGR